MRQSPFLADLVPDHAATGGAVLVMEQARDRIESLGLKDLIKILAKEDLLSPASVDSASAIKNQRDLIHPRRAMKPTNAVGKDTVGMTAHCLRIVTGDLEAAIPSGRMLAFEKAKA